MALTHQRLGLIGCVGIPNRYGGFESFAEHLSPCLQSRGLQVIVSCEQARYAEDLSPTYNGVRRLFIPIRANGALSPLHDLAAFAATLGKADHILVLGVSGGIFFPLFRLLASITGRRLLVNIDGVEWRRTKFGRFKRKFLYVSDWLAQRFSHSVIYDNQALAPYVNYPAKSYCVAYSGDHAIRHARTDLVPWQGGEATYALTVCRIEPENNCELLLEGFLASSLPEYRFVGNWNASEYGRQLRSRYGHHPRLRLMDPVYDSHRLYELRAGCSHYLHGHSVGGTNPSLVEMFYFQCLLLCFDCSFNRHTARHGAAYFANASDLAQQLTRLHAHAALQERDSLQLMYSASVIADALLDVLNVNSATVLPVGPESTDRRHSG